MENTRRPMNKNKPRIKWDEETIAKQQKERGVLYGTMKIDQPDTPFLYYDPENTESNGVVGEYVVQKDENNNVQREVNTVSISELQDRLGLLATAQSNGEDITTTQENETEISSIAAKPGTERVHEFVDKERQRIFKEKRTALEKEELNTWALLNTKNDPTPSLPTAQ